MADTLVIGGVTYNNVAGIKAKDSSNNTVTYVSGGGTTVYFEKHGIMYTENMVIPQTDSYGNTIATPRYIREQFQDAIYLKSYIQQYGTPATDSDYGLFRGCTNLETVWIARATIGNYSFESCTSLKHITVGRIGLAVTSLSGWSAKNLRGIETVTIYVDASDLSGVPNNVKNNAVPTNSHGAVVTYKNYQSGETIATVTVP